MNHSATQLSASNLFPNCVFIKLHSEPIQPESAISLIVSTAPLQQVSVKEFELKLTIRFGEQEIQVPGGRVCFGLKRGELKLKLENGLIPLEKTKLIARLETEIEFEEQQEKGKESEASIAIAAGIKTKDSDKTIVKGKYKAYPISTKGTEEEPVWVFETKTKEPILRGQLTQESLGVVQVNSSPCLIRAIFKIRGQCDLYLIESEGLLKAKSLSRNKTALLTREYFLRFIAPKLQPYISQVEVQYEC